MKTALAIRHVAFEDLGLIEPWLLRRGWRIVTYDAGVDELWKIDLDHVDLLVVLGGPIGAEDDARYPFLGEKVALIRQRIASGRAVLGVCLGAQLMARALGAAVAPMPAKEIGFAALAFTPEGAASPLAPLAGQTVLHWHGDEFAMPTGIASLARTAACPHQAFLVGDRAMAWQFHLEIDARRIEQWLIGHADELRAARIDLEVLRADALRQREGLARALDAVLSDWFARMAL